MDGLPTGTPLGLNPALYQKLYRRCVSAMRKTEKSCADKDLNIPRNRLIWLGLVRRVWCRKFGALTLGAGRAAIRGWLRYTGRLRNAAEAALSFPSSAL